MDEAEKATKMMEAANKLANEYINEGDSQTGQQLYNSFLELPIHSLARLYDILKS